MRHLHHLKNSRSFRIIWLLEELKLPYQLTTYERVRGLAPKQLKQIHPLGKAPILQDNDKTLIESAHIIEYIIDHYDGYNGQSTTNKTLRPDYGTPCYDQYRYWLHFCESSLMPLVLVRLIFGTLIQKSPIGIKKIAKIFKSSIEKAYVSPTFDEYLAFLNQHLADKMWLAGKFSGADIQLEFAIDAVVQQGGIDNKFTHIHSWLNRCYQREAYKIALQKGGKNQF